MKAASCKLVGNIMAVIFGIAAIVVLVLLAVRVLCFPDVETLCKKSYASCFARRYQEEALKDVKVELKRATQACQQAFKAYPQCTPEGLNYLRCVERSEDTSDCLDAGKIWAACRGRVELLK